MAAVRAIAPVAGIPPKRADIIFPIPCPINSAFDLCLLPIIPSETTAESRDSIAASIAIVKAGNIISRTKENDNDGIEKLGSPDLIVYKSPIVFTGNLQYATKSVVTKIATNDPGIFFEIFCQKI